MSSPTAALHNQPLPDISIRREAGLDLITGQPRVENTQYTCLTDEQLTNIQKKAKSETLFAPPVPKQFTNKRFVKDRYVDSYSQHLTRDGSGYKNHRFCYVDEQWNRFPKQKYDTCRPLASEKWGSYKCGINTAGYFYGQPTHKFTMIDMYRRNPTNMPGQIRVEFGRPGEGYYTQKYPAETTWNEAGVHLNRTKVLQTVPSKTASEYRAIEEYQKKQLGDIKEVWPHYSEYTDRMTMKTRIMPVLDQMERRKRHLSAAVNEVSQ